MILTQLREATAESHASLEAALPLRNAQLTRARYIHLLQSFHGFFAAWERDARLAADPFWTPLLTERARAHLLELDLAALGAAVPTQLAEELPTLHNTAALLGSMYVLEGSRLGGQYLVRDLEASLGLTPQHGLSFFYGFGPETGSRWKAFCLLLEANVTPVMLAEVLGAAQDTFAAFHRWILACDISREVCISVADSVK